MEEIITSVKNPKIKFLLELQQKSAARRKSGLFVVEGRREVEHCLEAGYEVESLFVSEQFIVNSEQLKVNSEHLKVNSEQFIVNSFDYTRGTDNSNFSVKGSIGKTIPNYSLFTVGSSLYEKIAYRGSTEGAIAIVKARQQRLEDLQLCEKPLLVVLESVEKPGNLGAVLRSADAAQADAVVVCDPLTDLYNPNLIRSSLGAVFTVPTVACSSEECIAFCRKNGIQILTAQLQDSHLYYDTPMTEGTAIVMGTESTGLTDQWRKAASAHIRIPMLGRLDSLNVSVSAAILLFEAVRQRQMLMP